MFYHHVSEKHCGELTQVQRTVLQDIDPSGQLMKVESEHPRCYHRFSAFDADLVPELHSHQFLGPKADTQHVYWATSFFKLKESWRGRDKIAARIRENFIREMRQVENTVWKPTSHDEDNKSETADIIYHSLDSLVWCLLTTEDGGWDLGDITFADVYLFFCRSHLLAYKRTHSTTGECSRLGKAGRKGKGSAKGTPADGQGKGKGKRG